LHAVFEVLPRVLNPRAGKEHHGRAHRPGDAGAQRNPERRQREPPVLLLLEDTDAGQQAHDAIERGGIRRRGLCQLAIVAGTILEQIG
jgi:hypothetical protein